MKCLNPTCIRDRKVRGLCRSCYATAMQLIKAGKITEMQLIESGRIKETTQPKGNTAWLLLGS